tara:strand:+ start:126 stop:377 length:252 start_codon:yes stop_codon:yes gene_type:complete
MDPRKYARLFALCAVAYRVETFRDKPATPFSKFQLRDQENIGILESLDDLVTREGESGAWVYFSLTPKGQEAVERVLSAYERE